MRLCNFAIDPFSHRFLGPVNEMTVHFLDETDLASSSGGDETPKSKSNVEGRKNGTTKDVRNKVQSNRRRILQASDDSEEEVNRNGCLLPDRPHKPLTGHRKPGCSEFDHTSRRCLSSTTVAAASVASRNLDAGKLETAEKWLSKNMTKETSVLKFKESMTSTSLQTNVTSKSKSGASLTSLTSISLQTNVMSKSKFGASATSLNNDFVTANVPTFSLGIDDLIGEFDDEMQEVSSLEVVADSLPWTCVRLKSSVAGLGMEENVSNIDSISCGVLSALNSSVNVIDSKTQPHSRGMTETKPHPSGGGVLPQMANDAKRLGDRLLFQSLTDCSVDPVSQSQVSVEGHREEQLRKERLRLSQIKKEEFRQKLLKASPPNANVTPSLQSTHSLGTLKSSASDVTQAGQSFRGSTLPSAAVDSWLASSLNSTAIGEYLFCLLMFS